VITTGKTKSVTKEVALVLVQVEVKKDVHQIEPVSLELEMFDILVVVPHRLQSLLRLQQLQSYQLQSIAREI
jgi:hypothetical protein